MLRVVYKYQLLPIHLFFRARQTFSFTLGQLFQWRLDNLVRQITRNKMFSPFTRVWFIPANRATIFPIKTIRYNWLQSTHHNHRSHQVVAVAASIGNSSLTFTSTLHRAGHTIHPLFLLGKRFKSGACFIVSAPIRRPVYFIASRKKFRLHGTGRPYFPRSNQWWAWGNWEAIFGIQTRGISHMNLQPSHRSQIVCALGVSKGER